MILICLKENGSIMFLWALAVNTDLNMFCVWIEVRIRGRHIALMANVSVFLPCLSSCRQNWAFPSSADSHFLKYQVHFHGAGGSCTQLFKSHSQNMYMPWRCWELQAGCVALPLQP